MKNLLAILLAFFRLGVGEPDDGQEDLSLDLAGDDQPPADDPPADDPPGDPDPQAELRAQLEAERSSRAEDRARAERFERELSELRASQHRPAPDAQVEEEERILRDPAATELQKWQVQANRQLRSGASAAQSALAQAQDVNDRTAFDTICAKNPRLERVKEEVEKTLTAMRAKGNNAPRSELAYYLLGQKVANAPEKKAPRSAAAPNPNLNRGRLPGARSDTSGRNAQTEREKRRARLENVQI